MPFLCGPLYLTAKFLQALSLLPPWPPCCLLKGAKVSMAAAAPPRSRPAMVPCRGMAQRAGSTPRGAEPSREPPRCLVPLPPWVFPWGCFNLLASWGKWHLTTPKLETGELGFTWLPQNVRAHSHPGEIGGTEARVQWGRRLH